MRTSEQLIPQEEVLVQCVWHFYSRKATRFSSEKYCSPKVGRSILTFCIVSLQRDAESNAMTWSLVNWQSLVQRHGHSTGLDWSMFIQSPSTSFRFRSKSGRVSFQRNFEGNIPENHVRFQWATFCCRLWHPNPAVSFPWYDRSMCIIYVIP